MTTRTLIQILCDLPHTTEVEAQTVTLIDPDGRTYEIDLCAQHVGELVTPLVKRARSVRPVRTPKAPRAARK